DLASLPRHLCPAEDRLSSHQPVTPAPSAEQRMSDLLNAALATAARGWPVFPCRPGRKDPATEHGFKDATTDPDQIRAWWAKRPDCNVAIPTGETTADVLDIDVEPDGNGLGALAILNTAGLLTGHGPV